MADELYLQTKLVREDGWSEVAWIQKKLAIKGQSVKFDDEVFRVDEVYPGALPWSVVNERGQDYKKTRSASDI